jgi:hypothetical protein
MLHNAVFPSWLKRYSTFVVFSFKWDTDEVDFSEFSSKHRNYRRKQTFCLSSADNALTKFFVLLRILRAVTSLVPIPV